MKVALATRNRHKVFEISEALVLPHVQLVGLDQLGDVPEVVEDGDTFEANAVKKAREVAEATGLPTLADDSGLVVDALDGAPGVWSARFAGAGANDAANREELRLRLEGVPAGERTARFVCVLALALPDGEVHTVEARCEGRLLLVERGGEGFGYDPLFVPDGEERTFAEMMRDEKAALSHRGKALEAMRPKLLELALAAGGGRS